MGSPLGYGRAHRAVSPHPGPAVQAGCWRGGRGGWPPDSCPALSRTPFSFQPARSGPDAECLPGRSGRKKCPQALSLRRRAQPRVRMRESGGVGRGATAPPRILRMQAASRQKSFGWVQTVEPFAGPGETPGREGRSGGQPNMARYRMRSPTPPNARARLRMMNEPRMWLERCAPTCAPTITPRAR